MDYYKILGLGQDASKDEIKAAFRKLALKFHPDRHAKSSKAVQEDAMRRFKEFSEAYNVLSDDKKRAAHSYNYGNTGFRHGYNANPYGSYRSGGGYNGGYNSYQGRRATYGSPSFSRFWYYGLSSPRLYFYMNLVIHGSPSFSRFWYYGLRSPRLYFYSMNLVIQAVFAGVLIGSLFIADATGKALWERQNTGKSFEETMNSPNQMKGGKISSTQKTKDSKEI